MGDIENLIREYLQYSNNNNIKNHNMTLIDDELVQVANQYFDKIGLSEDCIDFNEDDSSKISMSEYKLVEEIISIQVTFHLMRRSLVDGSLIDSMNIMIGNKISEYEKIFRREFNDFNLQSKW